jgi:hypothetical protein
MIRSEFEAGIRIMSETWTDFDRVYNAPRTELLWQGLNLIHLGAFTDAIERLVEKERNCPMPQKVISMCREAINKAKTSRAEERIKDLFRDGEQCPFCCCTGMVQADRRTDGARVAFRCTKCQCADIRNIARTLTEWSDEYRDQYIPYISRRKVSLDRAIRPELMRELYQGKMPKELERPVEPVPEGYGEVSL